MGNFGMMLLLFETPSGFALFLISGIALRDPDAMENLWANFAEDRKARRVAVLRGFQTFDDKFSAINPFTGVHEKLKNMIMECRRPGQKLAVGKVEYKGIIEKNLGIPRVCGEKVMEVMWGLKNLMCSLVPEEESELTKEDCLPMSHGLRKFLNRYGFDDIKPEMMKKHSVHLVLLGNSIKRVSRIDTQDWDSLKLATSLKVIFCPEESDYHEVFAEDERSKLMNDAHVYVREIDECLASRTYAKILATCEVWHEEKILLRNLVMKAKERMKGKDK